MRPCPQCSVVNEEHARFCKSCGVGLAGLDPLIGSTVADRYRIVSPIGEGGMGRVYLAEQRMGTVTRRVAIKVLTTSMADQLAVTRFYRECETVVQLTHPNTIRFYDFGALDVPLEGGAIDRKLYIAMEHIEGRTLASAIAAGPLPLETVDRFVRQIAGALTEAHKRGIVHRDLKPENVLLARNEAEGEIPKVCDFGIAKAEKEGQAEITAQGTIIGTPAYMSPEQIAGASVDERSDVYALGLMTFEMLTGARPFEARTPLEWATAHMTETPRSFDDFDATRGLSLPRRAAILRALAKDPGQRTPTVRAFQRDFSGESPSVSTPPEAASERSAIARGEAKTLATPGARPVPRAGASAAIGPTIVGLAVLSLILGGVIAAWAISGRAGGIDVGSSDAALLDAGLDAPLPAPRAWLGILHYEDRAADAPLALGAPDGRCARITPRGTITLELTPGVRIASDGTPAADLEIVIAEGSQGYRVDVGTERHRFTTIAQGLVATTPLDVDQFGIDRFRYVRIKNRGPGGGEVCIDAVGAYRSEP